MSIPDYLILGEKTELGLELAKANRPHAAREMTEINSLRHKKLFAIKKRFGRKANLYFEIPLSDCQ